MPEFQEVAGEYDGRVVFVGIDVGPFTNLGTREDGLRLVDDLQIRYPTGAAVDSTSLRAYGVRSMPTTVFLDKDGEIVSTSPGRLREPQLRAAVSKLLGEF